MLDFFTVFTRGGIILWCFHNSFKYKDNINNFINSVLIEERLDRKIFMNNDLSIEYMLSNERNLIYLAGYKSFLQITYSLNLINDFRSYFESIYDENFNFLDSTDFSTRTGELFDSLMRKYTTMSAFHHSIDSSDGSVSTETDIKPETVAHVDIDTKTENSNVINVETSNNKMIKSNTKTSSKAKASSNNQKKNARKWDSNYSYSAEDMKNLDYSENVPVNKDKTIHSLKADSMKGNLKPLVKLSSDEKDSQHEGFFGFFKNLLGGKELLREDIITSLDKMKDNLCGKNVAKEVVDQISQSILMKLEGTKHQNFKGLNSIVQNCLEETLGKILTAKNTLDIYDEIMNSKQHGKLYTIVFCGVNGVGKSTNLAKICYWLLDNDLNVLIAACDTFRSGAVEQLRTHVQRFNSVFENQSKCQLFDKGYGKDASVVASEAIKYGRSNDFDVLLIDTAGRMQDNEPLMRSLSKLIHDNQPDLVLFVGEALVGNDAVDQLVKFNNSLQQFAINSNPHVIDGIVLTKFDTVDDKVGAALSMSYISGKPIVFVGTGQSYSDLRKFNADSVIKTIIG